jgi:hypothetical protein
MITQAMHQQNQARKKHVSFASQQHKATLQCTNSGRHNKPEIVVSLNITYSPAIFQCNPARHKKDVVLQPVLGGKKIAAQSLKFLLIDHNSAPTIISWYHFPLMEIFMTFSSLVQVDITGKMCMNQNQMYSI